MCTWPNRGASGGPCGGLEERESQNPRTNLTVRPTGSDSSQQASAKPGAVHAVVETFGSRTSEINNLALPSAPS